MKILYGFSPSAKEFFLMEDRDVYIENGNWREDVNEINEEVWREFSSFPPKGKTLGITTDGTPCWVDADIQPTPHHEDEIKEEKRELLERADAEIRQLNVVKEVYGLTEDENLRLIAWKKHLAEVYRHTVRNEGPQQWPEPPDIQ